MVPQVTDRRSAERRTAEVDVSLAPELAAELLAAGWIVRSRAAADARSPACGLRVVRARPAAAERRRRGGCVALLYGGAEELAAATRTPFVYPLDAPAATLARLVMDAADVAGRARRRAEPPHASVLCVRLGEAVELDGVPLPLGVAERNFLYELAATPRAFVSKRARVEAGPGRRVEARECRRRLGKRLGGLASLLVPATRGEPYALRPAAEILRLGGPLLRVVGRSSVRSMNVANIEGWEDPDLP